MLGTELVAQTKVYANQLTSQSHVTDALKSVDQNESTRSITTSSSGALLWIGSYDGHIEVEFPTMVPANQTFFVRIETEENILDALLGGTLADVLSGLVGGIAAGNQNFTVNVKNNNNSVMNLFSGVGSNFSGEGAKIVVDSMNNKYLAITPTSPYNRVRITNNLHSLLGLGNKKTLQVWDVFYVSQPSLCNQAKYTSYDYSGVNLDLLGLSSVTENINRAIDHSNNTYSKLSLGVLGLAATITQRAHYESPSIVGEQFGIRFGLASNLLTIGVLNNITISAYKGQTRLYNQSLNSIITPAARDSLNLGLPTTIYFTPTASVDKIVFSFSSLLGVNVAQEIKIYNFIKRPSPPSIDLSNSLTSICEGTMATISATSNMPNASIYYYDNPLNGTPLASSPAGTPIQIGPFSNAANIFAAIGYPGCPIQSIRIPVPISVTPGPDNNDLSIPNLQSLYCAIDTINLTPHSSVGNQTRWHYANGLTSIIPSDTTINGISYSIDLSNNNLKISGASNTTSQIYVFLATHNSNTGCWSAPGDLLPVVINIQDELPPTLSSAIPPYCLIEQKTLADVFVIPAFVKWYDTINSSVELPSSTVMQPGHSYFAATVGTNCISSQRLEINPTILDEPIPTTLSQNQFFCSSDNATIADLQVTGTNITWYDNTGAPIPSSTVVVDQGHYYATSTGNDCESANKLEIITTISDLPTPTTNNTTQYFCSQNNPTVSDIAVTTSNVFWYENPTGGLALPAGTLLTDGQTYYGGIVSTNCISSVRLAITVHIETVSPANTSSALQQFCAPGQGQSAPTLADLSINPTTVSWYTQATGSTALPSTTALQHNTTYYAANQGQHCESFARTLVHVLINSPATPTTANSLQTFCSSVTPTVADLDVNNNTNITWYDAVINGNLLNSATQLVNNTSYFAFTHDQGCISPIPLEITVEVELITPPTFTNGTQVFCPQTVLFGPLTIANLSTNGQSINWYTSATSTSALAPSTPLVNGQTYYASQNGINCESNHRTAQYVVIESVSEPFATDTAQVFCGSTHPTLADIVISPSNVIWYDAQWGGIPLPLNTPLVTNSVYYAAGTNGNCESGDREQVMVAFEIVQPVTTSQSIQYFCEPLIGQPVLTIDTLSVNQTNVIWYDAPVGGTILSSTTPLVSGQTYYGASSQGFCQQTTRTPILVIVESITAPTVVNLIENYCSSEAPTLSHLQLTNPNIIWYDAPVNGNILSTNDILVNNTHYYGEINNGTCASTSRVDVLVNIEIVSPPTFNNGVQLFCPPVPPSQNLTVADLNTQGQSIVWYNSAINGNIIPTTTALTNGSTYYASNQGIGCNSSIRIPVVVQIANPSPPTTQQANQHFCGSTTPTIDQISVNQSGVTWYMDQAYTTVVQPGTNLINGQMYYGTLADINGCINSNPLTVTTTFSIYQTPSGFANVQFFCNTTGSTLTLADLDVQNLNVTWYDNANQGNVLATTTPLVGNTTYYAFTSSGTCVNPNGAAIHVVFENIPPPTTTSSQQAFCGNSVYTLADIQVNENGVIWYSTQTGGTPLVNTMPLTDQMTYYAALESQNCSSNSRLAVTVSVNQVQPPTTNNNVQIFCSTTNSTIDDLQVNESNVQWYTTPTGSTPLSGSTTLQNNTIYYAGLTQGACDSQTRLAIYVILENLSAPTSSSSQQHFCATTPPTINQIAVDQMNVVWRDINGAPLAGSTPLVNGQTYYAFTQGIHCISSQSLAITITIDNPNNGQITIANPTPCIGDTIKYTAPTGMTNYNWVVNGGQVVATSPDESEVFIVWNATIASLDLSYTTMSNCIIHLPNSIQIQFGNCSDLEMKKVANTTSAFIGDHVEFTITVTNVGTGIQSNVIVSEIIRNGFNYINHTSSIGTYSPISGEWIIPTMAANSTATLIVTAEVLEGGDHTNVASITHSDIPDDNPNNDTATVYVDVECLTVYNEISPNGDGKNDVLVIDCIQEYPNNTLTIFNRFGTLVYTVNNYKNDWAGTANKGAVYNSKEDLPAGTYFYVLSIENDEKKEKTGWIYIIR